MEKITVIPAIVLIFLISIAVYFGLFRVGPLVTVPITPFPTESPSNYYTCDSLVCKVQGKLFCTTAIEGLYSCDATFEKLDSLSALVASETLSYQSNSTGGNKSSAEYSMVYGETARILGTGAGTQARLYFGTYEESCNPGNKPKCNLDNTGYYDCISYNNITFFADKSHTNYCDVDNGFFCDNYIGNCSFLFKTKEIKLIDINNIAKSGFTLTDNIRVSSKLISDSIALGDVTYKIWKLGDPSPISNFKISNYNFQLGSAVLTNIDNPQQNGVYYLTMDISVAGRTIVLGGDQSYSFRIAPPISCSINIVSTDQSSTFINSPVLIELNTYNNVGASDVDKINLTAMFNNAPFNINPNDYQKPPIESAGALTYTYATIFDKVGVLDVYAQVTKNNVVSQTCSMVGKQIQANKIIAEYTNLDNLQCVPTSRQTIRFETRNSMGVLTDTTNTLKVTDQFAVVSDISDRIISDATGKYHFDYDFVASTGGNAYAFTLNSFSNQYNIGSEPLAGTIEARTDCSVKECSKNTDCSSKGVEYICYQNKCQLPSGSPNWILYLGIVVIVILLGVIIFIIVKYVRQKK